MTIREINEWMERYAAAFQEGGFTPLQAVRLCSWHMTDKREQESMSMVMPVLANCCETDTSEMP